LSVKQLEIGRDVIGDQDLGLLEVDGTWRTLPSSSDQFLFRPLRDRFYLRKIKRPWRTTYYAAGPTARNVKKLFAGGQWRQ
jgi:hypothetical protein